MRNLILVLLLWTLTLKSQVHVKGYYKSNGTYVQPHTRSSPDGNPYNNYSYPGNYNPNTGKTSTGNTDKYLENYYKKDNATKSSADVWVEGYFKKDGTYVEGHWRSAPNGDPYDNFSFPGNINPYTGKIASGNPETFIKNYYVSSTSLNIRAGPSTNYSVVTTLNYGDQIEVIENYDEKWTKVKVKTTYLSGNTSDNEIGYVYSPNVSNTNRSSSNNKASNSENLYYNPSEVGPTNWAFVNTSVLNVRKGASTEQPTIITLGLGEKVEMLYKANSNWTAIKVTYWDESSYSHKTTTGYVFSTFLSSTNPVSGSNIDFSKHFNYNSYNENTIKSTSKNIDEYSTKIYHPYGDGNGKITFWTDCGTDGEISIYIDNTYIGKLTKYFEIDSKPDCESDGTVAAKISSGLHKMVASGQKLKWEGYITITEDRCLLQHLKN